MDDKFRSKMVAILDWLEFEWWWGIYNVPKISQWRACWSSMGRGPEHIFELWLRIGISTWHSMGCGPKWLPWVVARDSRWTRGTLSYGSGWRVCWWSVLVVASTDGSRWISLLSESLTSLVVLGRCELCSYLGTSPGVTVWSVAWFPHVLYRLWPIGVAVRRFEIPNMRCRRLLTWL